MDILQEVYFGKEAVAPMQKQFSVIRNKLINKPFSPTINLDPDIIKFNRIVEKIFGFHSFALNIQPDHTINAYAIPVDVYLTDEEKMKIRSSLLANPTGFKYNANTMGVSISLIIAINLGLMESTRYTDEEIVAIMLHEIGHGFFEAVVDPDGEYTVAKKLVASLSYALGCAKMHVKYGKEVTGDMVDRELHRISGYIGNLRSNIIRLSSKAKKRVFRESMSDNMVKKRLSYTNEKFADTFAAMFGYGTEIHSALTKITKDAYDTIIGVKKYPKIVETIKMYKIYIDDLIAYAFNAQDEHPEHLARVKTSVDYIKRELSKEGLDPKIKNQLIEQLNSLNKLIEDYKNFPKDQDSMRILRLYHVKLYEKFGGDRREKDTDNDSLFAAIDDRYKDLMDSEDNE